MLIRNTSTYREDTPLLKDRGVGEETELENNFGFLLSWILHIQMHVGLPVSWFGLLKHTYSWKVDNIRKTETNESKGWFATESKSKNMTENWARGSRGRTTGAEGETRVSSVRAERRH